MHVRIKFGVNIIPLLVRETDTINNLKAMIQHVKGIHPDNQLLLIDIHPQMALEGNCTLDHYGILDGSFMRLEIKHMHIRVEIGHTGKTIPLEVSSIDTIDCVKDKIQDKEGISLDMQCLSFCGIPLKGYNTLGNYGIIPGSALHLDIHQMQISIEIFTGKTITLEVKSSDTISDVKIEIQAMLEIPPHKQKLFFAETELVDGFTIADYRIYDKSTLHLVSGSSDRIKIFIKSVMGKTTSLQVKISDTISMVKAKIHDKDGIPLEQQMLFFDEKQLNDDCTVADCHIENGSTLDLQLGIWRGSMHIFVKTDKGKTITLEVKDSDTIGDLKIKIRDAEGVPPDDMNLFYNGQQLDNGRSLARYYIHKGSTLNLFVIDRGPMEIFVKAAFTGKTIKTLEVQSPDTVGNLKALIEDSEGIPTDQQMLLFDGNQLHDHQVLGCYYIQNKSTIYLLPLSRGVVQILIKMPEKAIIMKVESSDTIGNLKSKIQESERIPSGQQLKLLFKGKELDNCCKIADYNICWNSVLHLVHGSRRLMQIAIMSESGRTTIHVTVESSDTVGHVKAKIAEEEGFSLNDRSLLYNKNLLEDSRTLADYDIKNNSVLHFGRLPLST